MRERCFYKKKRKWVFLFHIGIVVLYVHSKCQEIVSNRMMNKEYWFSGEPKVLQLLIKEIGVQEPGMTKEKQLASMFSSARSIWTLILPRPQHKEYLVHFYLCWNVGGHPLPSRAPWKDHQEFLQGKGLNFINHHTIICNNGPFETKKHQNIWR